MKYKVSIVFVVLTKLIISILIFRYYWNASELFEIKKIPLQIIILGIIYIACQMLTRKLTEVSNWWDWVYYAGLLSMMIPATFANSTNQNIFHSITDFGTVLLIIPALVDMYIFIFKKIDR